MTRPNTEKQFTIIKMELLSYTESVDKSEAKILATFHIENPARPLQMIIYSPTLEEEKWKTIFERHFRHVNDDAWCLKPEKCRTITLDEEDRPQYVHIVKNDYREESKEISNIGSWDREAKSITIMSCFEKNRRQLGDRVPLSGGINFSWEVIASQQKSARERKFNKIRDVFGIVKKAVGLRKAVLEFKKAGML